MAGNKGVAKVDKKTKKRVEKLRNAYNLYVARLDDREMMTAGEKRKLMRQFFDNNIDEINDVIISKDYQNKLEPDLQELGFDQKSIDFIYAVYCYKNNKTRDKARKGELTGDKLGEVRNALSEAVNAGSREDETDHDDLNVADDSPQAKGMRQIAAWMYRNSEVTTLANRQKGKKGKESKMIFIESVLAKTAKERLLIYYLVENGKTKNCTLDDVIASQTYVPDLAKFKEAMLAGKLKRFLGRAYVKWDILGQAVQTADSAIGASSSAFKGDVPDVAEGDFADVVNNMSKEYAEKSGKADENQDLDLSLDSEDVLFDDDDFDDDDFDKGLHVEKDINGGGKGNKYRQDGKLIADDIKLIPAITKRMRALIDKDPVASKEKDMTKITLTDEKDLEEYEKLRNALSEVQSRVQEYVNKKASEDTINSNIETDDIEAMNTMMFKKLGDAMFKLPLALTVSVGSALGLAAIIIRIGGLIKNRNKLNAADKWMRVAELGASCADFAANASKAGMFASAVVTTGNTLAGAAAMSSATATTVSGALGVVSGGLSMISAGVEAGRAAQINKSRKKTDAYLDNAKTRYEVHPENYNVKIGKNLAMANNIRAFMDSAYHSRVFKASTKMVSGSLTALGGALTLTGLGAVAGIPLMAAGIASLIAQKVGSAIQAKKETAATVDRFLKLDEIMENEMFDPIKDNKECKKLVRNELRQYGMAQMGAASVGQAYNIIMSRYATFLYQQIFIKDEGGFYTKEESDSLVDNDADNEIRMACKEIVKAMGVKLRFGENGEEPKTKVSDIRRRMII